MIIYNCQKGTEKEVRNMTKYYYIDLAATPFTKVHIYDERLKQLPKYWQEITKEEYEELTNELAYCSWI